MGHLSPPKPHSHLRLVSMFKKAFQASQLGLVVALSRTRAEFHLFELNLLLFLSCRLPFLALLKDKLAIVHQAADGGLRVRGYLHQVELRRFRKG